PAKTIAALAGAAIAAVAASATHDARRMMQRRTPQCLRARRCRSSSMRSKASNMVLEIDVALMASLRSWLSFCSDYVGDFSPPPSVAKRKYFPWIDFVVARHFVARRWRDEYIDPGLLDTHAVRVLFRSAAGTRTKKRFAPSPAGAAGEVVFAAFREA